MAGRSPWLMWLPEMMYVVEASPRIEDQIAAAIRRIIRTVDLYSRRLADEHGLTGPSSPRCKRQLAWVRARPGRWPGWFTSAGRPSRVSLADSPREAFSSAPATDRIDAVLWSR